MIFEAHQNPYFVRLYCINILTNTFLTTKFKKIGPHFLYFFEGGKGAERKWWKENVNQKMLLKMTSKALQNPYFVRLYCI